jgi:hypothetical protein
MRLSLIWWRMNSKPSDNYHLVIVPIQRESGKFFSLFEFHYISSNDVNYNSGISFRIGALDGSFLTLTFCLVNKQITLFFGNYTSSYQL